MDRSQVERLLEPVSTDSACGPDLDLDGDADFLNALARAESLLPGQFFQKQDGEALRPYPRGLRDFEPQIRELEDLLTRSRDVRLIVLLAKFFILDRRLPDFVNAVDLIARLVATRWDDVNPKGEDGDFLLRMAALQALDDRPHVVLPLQFTPLIRHPRAGVFTWRSKNLADGAEAMDGETAPDPASLQDAFATADLAQIVEQRDHFARLDAALETIHATTSEHVGPTECADVPLARAAGREILGFLDTIVRERDPSAAPPAQADEADAASERAAGLPSTTALGDIAAVAASLAGVASYFQQSEPSNPALLLVRQAERLVGRTFAEVMQILLPEQVEAAAIEIGRRQTFAVPVSRLADGIAAPDERPKETTPPPLVADRKAALTELRKIEAFYAEREPTSPIPFFCERARKLAGQDFLSILGEILPEAALKTIDGALRRDAAD